ncbi:MAG: thioredoxin family protein [Bacteroidota bacterium]
MLKFILPLAFLMAITPSTQADLWTTDWTEAQAMSKEQEKPILLVFCGLDWCRSCILQENEIFNQTAFESYAKEELILVKANFPRRKKNQLEDSLRLQNEQLAEKYNPTGSFPYNVLISPEGKVLGSCSYRAGGTEPFLKLLASWSE